MIELAGVAVLALLGAGLLAAAVGAAQLHTAKTADGEVVPADVQLLAGDAGASPDQYALARVCASEAGGQRRVAKLGVAWVVVNEANRRKVSPLEVVLGSASAFGPQGTGGRGFVSSARDPVTVDFDVAAAVDTGSEADPTGGAVNFDSPGAYKDKVDDAGNVLASAQERADAFAAAREKEGKHLVLLDGVPERTFRFWGLA